MCGGMSHEGGGDLGINNAYYKILHYTETSQGNFLAIPNLLQSKISAPMEHHQNYLRIEMRLL